MARERCRIYKVICAVAGGPVEREVLAETLPLACKLAENALPEGRAVHVTMEVDIIGRCAKCEAYIEAEEYHDATPNRLLCGDCL